MRVGLEADVPTVNGSFGKEPPDWKLYNVNPRSPREARAIDHAVDAWSRANGQVETQRVSVPESWLPWNP